MYTPFILNFWDYVPIKTHYINYTYYLHIDYLLVTLVIIIVDL